MFRQGALRFYSGKTWAAWVYPEGVFTAFNDGSSVLGVPPKENYFAESARFLGYGEDTYWHMVEHDLCHLMVADELRLRSGALWAQAHGWSGGEMPKYGLLEEQRLVAVQRMINGLKPDREEWGQIGYADLQNRLGDRWSVVHKVDEWRNRLRREGNMTCSWARATALTTAAI